MFHLSRFGKDGVVVTAAIQLFARAEVELGGTGFRLISEDLDDAARGCRLDRTGPRWPAGPAQGRPPDAARGWLHSDHPVRCAGRLRTGQLGRARRRAGGCAVGRPG